MWPMSKRAPAPLDKAVQAAGGYDAFCAKMSIARRTAFSWIEKGEIPLQRVLEIERVTGIPRHELRPDAWDAPVTLAQVSA